MPAIKGFLPQRHRDGGGGNIIGLCVSSCLGGEIWNPSRAWPAPTCRGDRKARAQCGYPKASHSRYSMKLCASWMRAVADFKTDIDNLGYRFDPE